MKKYFNYFIDNFLIEKEVNQGLSKKTILTYYTLFNHLIDNPYVDLNNPSTFTEMSFKRFLGELLIKNSWTSHTYNRNKKNAKVFCDFLIKEQFIFENPLSKIPDRKIDKSLPKIFTQKQIDSIIYMINNYYNTTDFITIRNKTAILTYIYSGIRFSELVNLNLSDLNLEEGYIKITKGKGGKDRYVPIINKLHIYLKHYLQIRYYQNYKKEVLFPTKYGNNLQYREIYKINKNLESKLGFKINTHMFRHTFATELVKKNLNLYNISQILGHTKLDTTKIYLNFDTNTVRESINMMNLYA